MSRIDLDQAPRLHVDFETRSEVDIKKVGSHAYAMHPSTRIMCLGYAFEAEPVGLATGADLERGVHRDRLVDLARDPRVVLVAHNAGGFEHPVWKWIMTRTLGFPDLEDPSRWDCTMARALMCGLPASLENVGRVMGIKMQKDLSGRAALMKLCKPLERDPLGDAVWHEDSGLYQKLYAYCAQDVEAERELDAVLPRMTAEERRVWELDLRINARGVQVDVGLATRAAALADTLTVDLNARLRAMTGGRVEKATRIQAIKNYLADQGVHVDSLDKPAVTEILASSGIPQHVKDVVTIRRQVGKSSTAKYTKAVEAACPDGRVRGVLQYHAAHTGRWGGRLIQPQNYPQGYATAEEQGPVVADILESSPDVFALTYGDESMEALSKALRGTIIAAPGKALVSADYNAIEARVLFWLAGDRSALDCYRRGDSPYVEMAKYIYGRSDITKKGNPREYDIGKRAVLGCGYGMGPDKFQLTVKNQAGYDIPLELAQRAVKAYREKYSAVKALWYATEAAAIAAVKTPGSVHRVAGGRVAWGMTPDRRFLVARLPSGRSLWYFRPSTRVVPTPWGEKEELCYWGEHPKTSQWCQLKTYGGALAENVTQATARDIMAAGMLNVEAGGFPVVLTCHDELLAEILLALVEALGGAQAVVKRFIALMCDLPKWAAGCPISAEGWVGERYRK